MTDTFKAATWNVFHGTKATELRPLLEDRLDDGVSLFLFQELSSSSVRQMVRDAGLKLLFHPRQYGIAYLPDLWVPVDDEGVRLGKTHYWRRGGDNRQWSEAEMAILSDRQGRTLTALSYHTPSGVQVNDPPENRLQALRESMATMRDIARAAETRAILFGGDDNVDEERAFKERFGFMKDRRVGLRQVQAPRATHGKRRKIDDFRVKGLRVGRGSVHDGGGDHKVHVRKFAWL